MSCDGGCGRDKDLLSSWTDLLVVYIVREIIFVALPELLSVFPGRSEEGGLLVTSVGHVCQNSDDPAPVQLTVLCAH